MANYDVTYNQLPENEEERASQSGPGNLLPESPETPPFRPPGNFLPESPETPPFRPPGNFLPESPETPPFRPPGNFLPESPETPPFGPPQEQGGSNIPNWRPPIVIPIIPAVPSRPSVGAYCNIRFLHAAVNQPGVSIFIDNSQAASRLTYSNMTNYGLSQAGYIVVTIRNSTTNSVINRTAFTVTDGGIYTVALVNSADGIALYIMEDTNCNKSVYNSCIRVANLTNNAPTLDILLSGSQLIYQNVRFLDVTEYRQINPGMYTISVASSQHCTEFSTINNRAVQIIPVIIGIASNNCFRNILVTSRISIERDMVYTVYIIGNAYSAPFMQMILAESYFEY